MYRKLKSFLENDSHFFVIVILLVGAISFGLGRLSIASLALDESRPVLTEISPPERAETVESSVDIPVVASQAGSRYHLFDCPGAQQMKIENRIEFASIDDAEAAGYTPAANCPGLRE